MADSFLFYGISFGILIFFGVMLCLLSIISGDAGDFFVSAASFASAGYILFSFIRDVAKTIYP